MQTHAPILTTVPTDQPTLGTISPHWLALAGFGMILLATIGISLLILSSAAHRTLPTLGRAMWLRDVILAPAAAVCCLALTTAVAGTSHELSSKRATAHAEAANRMQSALAEQSPTSWECEPVDEPSPTMTTVSCTPAQ